MLATMILLPTLEWKLLHHWFFVLNKLLVLTVPESQLQISNKKLGGFV
jgi:hypothetical protein